MQRTSRASFAPPQRTAADALPPALRRWWDGQPRMLVQDTAAFLLPTLLPLQTKDRLLVVGDGAAALSATLAARVPLASNPVALLPDALHPCGGLEEGRVDLIRAPVTALPFQDAYFTIVMAGHQMRAWDDAALLRFLKESWRVLTHNGLVVVWEVAPSRSPRVNAVWRRVLARNSRPVRLRSFAEIGRAGREAGFAWIQTLRLRPFLWPPGPRVAVLMRKEHYDPATIHLRPGETPD